MVAPAAFGKTDIDALERLPACGTVCRIPRAVEQRRIVRPKLSRDYGVDPLPFDVYLCVDKVVIRVVERTVDEFSNRAPDKGISLQGNGFFQERGRSSR